MTTQQAWHRVANAATLPIGFDHAVGACLLQLGVPLYHDPDQPGAVRVEIDRHAAYDEDKTLALIHRLGKRGWSTPGYAVEQQENKLFISGIIRLGQAHHEPTAGRNASALPVERTGWRYFVVAGYWVNLHTWLCGCGGDALRECQHLHAAVTWSDGELRRLGAEGCWLLRSTCEQFYNGAYHRIYPSH